MSGRDGNIHTGDVTGQAIAIGHGAKATFRASGDPKLAAQVTEKLAELSALKMLLSAITGAASGIATITTAVAGVRGLLGL